VTVYHVILLIEYSQDCHARMPLSPNIDLAVDYSGGISWQDIPHDCLHWPHSHALSETGLLPGKLWGDLVRC